MGKLKELCEFDMGQIGMVRWQGQSISKTAALVGCSQSAVVSIYQKWLKEGTVVTWRQGHVPPRLIDAHGERRLPRVVRSNRWATVAQLLKRLMRFLTQRCQNTQCIAVFVYGSAQPQTSQGAARWPLSIAKSANNGQVSIRTWPQSNGKKVAGLKNHIFFYIMWMAGCTCVAYLRKTRHQDALREGGKPTEAVWCFGQCSAGKP